MSAKLELEITLDSKGAVSGVKSLNTEIEGLDKRTQGADISGRKLAIGVALGTFAYNAASKALSIFTGFIKDSVAESIEAERVTAALNSALSITGRPVEAMSRHFDEYAKALQKVTIYDDEATKGAIALLVNLTNLDQKGLDRATKGAMGLAATMGVDLNTAAMTMVRAIDGNYIALHKIGIEIDKTKSKQEQQNQVLDETTKLYPNATAAAQTFGGQLAILANAFGEVKEKAGDALLKGMKPFIDELKKPETLSSIEEFATTAGESIGKMGVILAGALKGWNNFTDALDRWGYAGKYAVQFDDLGRAVKGHDYILKEDNKTTAEATAGTNKFKDVIKTVTAAIKTQNQIFQERLDKVYENFQQDEAWIAFLKKEFGSMPKVMETYTHEVDALNESMLYSVNIDEMKKKALDDLKGEIGEASVATEKWYKDAQDLAAGLTALANVFDDLIPGLGGLVSGFMGAYEGINKLKKEIADTTVFDKFGNVIEEGTASLGTMLGTIGAVVGAAMAITKAATAAFGNMYDNYYNKIHAQILAIQAAFDAEIAAAEAYAKTWQGILDGFDKGGSVMKRGLEGLRDTVDKLGVAFNDLLADAKKYNTEGSAEMIAMFDDLAIRGLRVKEVQDYINASLNAGLAGYKAMKAAMTLPDGVLATAEQMRNAMAATEAFGNMNIQVFEDMIAYEKHVAENQGLVDGIEGATAAMVGLSNAQRLTEQQFDDFASAGYIAYQKLEAGGMSDIEAMKTMAPYLQRLQFLHEQYGYTIDDATQKLIDEGIASGTVFENQKSETTRMVEALESLVEMFRGTLPKALVVFAESAIGAFGKAIDAAAGLNDEIGKMGGGDYNIPGEDGGRGKADVYAAGGFYSPRISSDLLIQTHAPEPVAIGESGFRAAGLNSGGGRTTNLNITITGPGVTPEAVADAAITAHRNNTHGFRSVLEN